MKIKNLIGLQVGLKELAGEKLPVVVAYKLAKIIEKTEKELLVFNSIRIKKLKQYGVLNEVTNNYDIETSKMKDWNDEYLKLLEIVYIGLLSTKRRVFNEVS
jgi:hypothetical protein